MAGDDVPPSKPTTEVDHPAKTVVWLSRTDRILLGAVPLLGALLGLAVQLIARWVADLPWAPMQGLFELIASFGGGWTLAVCAGVGMLLGAAVGLFCVMMCLRLTFTGTTIQARIGDDTRTIEGAEVAAAFTDGPYVVILDDASRQLLREKHEASHEALSQAFTAHGYRWLPEDPYAQLFRRWVPDTPDLSGTVNALLKAREAALQKKSATDVAELRAEIQKLGSVVRDEGTRQYWRPLIRL